MARFLYVMDHMLKEPRMKDMVDQLDGYYSSTAQATATHDNTRTPEVPPQVETVPPHLFCMAMMSKKFVSCVACLCVLHQE